MHQGEPLPADEQFERSLETLLDRSGDYVEADKEAFDAMEREALDLLRRRRSSYTTKVRSR